MKNAISGVIVFFFIYSSSAQSIAPSIINSSGGTYKSGYYQFEWSVGELALVNQMNSSSIIITNGFIQPYTHKPIGQNSNSQFGNDEIKVFPNPATDYVEINFFTKQEGKINISMFDAAGRVVWNKELTSYGLDLIERIPVTQLGNASYFLKIDLIARPGFTSKNGVYKIVKIK